MNKKEIEFKIIEECKAFLPRLNGVPFDKGLPILRKEAWRIADKYGTDGANVINIMLSNFPKDE